MRDFWFKRFTRWLAMWMYHHPTPAFVILCVLVLQLLAFILTTDSSPVAPE